MIHRILLFMVDSMQSSRNDLLFCRVLGAHFFALVCLVWFMQEVFFIRQTFHFGVSYRRPYLKKIKTWIIFINIFAVCDYGVSGVQIYLRIIYWCLQSVFSWHRPLENRIAVKTSMDVEKSVIFKLRKTQCLLFLRLNKGSTIRW